MIEETDSRSCYLLSDCCVLGIVLSSLWGIFGLISVTHIVEEDLRLSSMLLAKKMG